MLDVLSFSSPVLSGWALSPVAAWLFAALVALLVVAWAVPPARALGMLGVSLAWTLIGRFFSRRTSLRAFSERYEQEGPLRRTAVEHQVLSSETGCNLCRLCDAETAPDALLPLSALVQGTTRDLRDAESFRVEWRRYSVAQLDKAQLGCPQRVNLRQLSCLVLERRVG